MSEPKLISPMLDGFMMGDPISDRHGVRCCPAMQKDSDNKYIVKIISVPASQVKLDALLLAGAFSDTESAKVYFKDLADGIVEEAVLLQRLSRLEGFIPFDNWQVVPMENGETGYDIYLVGAYRPTLERYCRRHTMTHLAAVNLGLDMCASLAVCRRSGYLYADLKPGNIYVCDDREYRIGDLGFIPLASLNYASLPEKYLSAYTAPEITDAYSALNDTIDVYAAGMILYQIYNGGLLPFEERASADVLPAPAFADYEMAQIILKACAPDPADRWQDPLQMGQALVSYMQRNEVNDTPIIPPILQEEPVAEPVAEEPDEAAETEPTTEDILAEVDQALDAVGGPVELPVEEETPAEEEAPAEEEVPTEEDAPAEEEVSTEEEVPTEEDAPAEEEVPTEEEVPAEEEVSESAYAAEAAALKEELGVSDEVSQILAQAEDLIAHETPEPVVAPEPIEVTLPLPVEETEEEVTEETEEEALTETVEEEAGEEDHSDEEADSEEEPAQPKKKRSGWLIALISLVLLADLCIGGYLFYERYYLQTIYDMNLNGVEDKLTVSLNTTVDEELLTVYCTDTYGNTLKQSVENGKAVFEGLKSATSYKITVQISGLHKLIGETTGTHVTSEQTTIAGFTAATGSEDGSVILNFTIQGQDSSDWKVTYKADGEEEKSVTFSGHMVTINGLTVGSKYTFRLEPVKPLFLAGTDTVQYTATSIIYAEDLVIEGIQAGTLIASWKAPEGSSVKSWTVRCYNDTGYDKTITVEDTKVSFPDIDVASAYTIEVNATGMTMGIRGYVSANSVTVKSLRVNDSNHNQLSLSWEFDGTAPQGGWLILYSIDGSTEQQVVKCAETNGVIFPVVPGSHYAISIQSADGNTVFGGQTEFTAPEALTFSGYLLTAANMEFKMCKTPSIAEWTQYNVPAADYKTTYAIGENASFAVHLNHEYNTSADEIVTLFVIRDASGKIVSTATQSRTWTSMWYRGFGRINIPALPQSAGEYTLEVYFNSALAHTQSFSMA